MDVIDATELVRDFDRDATFRENCVRAIESAAAKLGMDPATLAEQCKDGEIADLALASLTYMETPEHASAETSLAAYETLDAALQPFAKE